MNELERDLNELLELSEQERFKPSPELLACGRLENLAISKNFLLEVLTKYFYTV